MGRKCDADGNLLDEPGEDFPDREDPADPDAMARLLWHIVSYFGAEGSRYDERRVTISVGPGDKYEGDKKPN